MVVASIRVVSECFVKPDHIVDESTKPFYFGSMELMQMSHCHIQTGLMFNKLPSNEEGGMNSFLEKLKESLSSTLALFYPLAGQLVTEVDEAQHNSFIFIDNNKGSGAKLIHACLDNVTVDDILSSTYVPGIVQSLFALGRIPTNYDAHDEPILVIQLTELVDGIFLGVSINHAIVDGTTLWHFLSSWSEIFRSNDTTISRQPIYERWFPDGYGPIIKFPSAHPDEFINRYQVNTNNTIRELILHISLESLATLKAKANADCGLIDKISSVQALSALLWRVLARSRGLKTEESSICYLVANARSRVHPPLSQDYFGSFIWGVVKPIRVGELLENSLGYVASLLNQGVCDQLTDERIRDGFIQWIKSPTFYKPGESESNAILIGGVPRVNLSRIEFGVGKVVAIRTGSNKYDGKVILRPGIEEEGSLSVEICLSRNTMINFQQDVELMSFLSSTSILT